MMRSGQKTEILRAFLQKMKDYAIEVPAGFEERLLYEDAERLMRGLSATEAGEELALSCMSASKVAMLYAYARDMLNYCQAMMAEVDRIGHNASSIMAAVGPLPQVP